jgi:hypothetical protein
MLKNFFAFIGFAVITLLIVISIAAMGLFYDQIGLVELPRDLPSLAELAPGEVSVQVHNPGVGKTTWTNPLDLLPLASATLPPTAVTIPTVPPTPVPPLDPLIYRAQTMSALRQFAADLELWMDANNRFAQDGSLLQQGQWRTEAQQALDQSAASAWTLAQVGPAPGEYAAIDSMLELIYGETETLRATYVQAMTYADAGAFQAAGESFERLREYIRQAATAMAQAGWSVE